MVRSVRLSRPDEGSLGWLSIIFKSLQRTDSHSTALSKGGKCTADTQQTLHKWEKCSFILFRYSPYNKSKYVCPSRYLSYAHSCVEAHTRPAHALKAQHQIMILSYRSERTNKTSVWFITSFSLAQPVAFRHTFQASGKDFEYSCRASCLLVSPKRGWWWDPAKDSPRLQEAAWY